MNPLPDAQYSSSSWLVHQWVIAGIVSSAARFIPVPFVDDLVRDQCRRFVVSRTLASHERSDSLAEFKPYYSGGGGCFSGCVGSLAKAPLKLLLFPVRKIIAIATSIHGVPLEVMRTVLLGRTLDRFLQTNETAGDAQDAAAMRIAFDETFKRMDFRVVRAAILDSLRGIKDLKTSAIKTAKRIAESDGSDAETLSTEEPVDQGASRVQEVLNRPETLELFAEFDRRFDVAIGRV